MIDNAEARKSIAEAIGNALNELVRERMTGLVEEPDITSRVGQRLEDRFDGALLRGYKISVISETITSHGGKSLEKPMGADLYFAISVEDKLGHQKSKGILVQAKRFEMLNWPELEEQCRRMMMVTKKGSVVWIYNPSGISVLRSNDVRKRTSLVFSPSSFFDRVLECEIGDQRQVPRGSFGDRPKLISMLKTLGARNAVWLDLEKR